MLKGIWVRIGNSSYIRYKSIKYHENSKKCSSKPEKMDHFTPSICIFCMLICDVEQGDLGYFLMSVIIVWKGHTTNDVNVLNLYDNPNLTKS